MIGDKIEFEVVAPIVAKQRPKATSFGGHARVYTPSETVMYERIVRDSFRDKFGDFSFKDKPLILTVIAYYKKNKELEKFGQLTDYMPKVSKGDIDNVVKSIMDGLTLANAWDDDAQVWSLVADKKYSADGREYVWVQICEYGDSLDNIKNKYKNYKNNIRLQELIKKKELGKKLTKEQLAFIENNKGGIL